MVTGKHTELGCLLENLILRALACHGQVSDFRNAPPNSSRKFSPTPMEGMLVSRSDAKVRLMKGNSRTVNGPFRCFTVCTDCTDRQIVSPLTKFNEMQFTDCQQTDSLFYNPYRLYRSSSRFTPWSTNRCIQLSDRQRIEYYFFSLTDSTDCMINLTDCISASILDMSGTPPLHPPPPPEFPIPSMGWRGVMDIFWNYSFNVRQYFQTCWKTINENPSSASTWQNSF